jgi:hypothetical protein
MNTPMKSSRLPPKRAAEDHSAVLPVELGAQISKLGVVFILSARGVMLLVGGLAA